MIKYLYLFIAFILELIVLNYLNSSYLYPMFTVVSVAMFYNLFKVKKEYNIAVTILSLLYGLLFLNNVFLGFLIFFVIKEFIFFVYKNFNINLFKVLILCVMCIVINDVILYLFLLMPFAFVHLAYKVLNSLIINILFMLFLYPLISFSSKF
jgi:hypothetical protein